MTQDRYTHQTQPSLGDKAAHKAYSTYESGKTLFNDAKDAVNLPPSPAAVWIAVLVGICAWKASSGILSNFGGRSGVATLVRPVIAGLLTFGAASLAHDTYLESKGYQVNGRTASGSTIPYSKPAGDFDKAARGPKRIHDYAPVYGADYKAPGTQRSGSQAGESDRDTGTRSRHAPEALAAESHGDANPVPVTSRRHNQRIATPE